MINYIIILKRKDSMSELPLTLVFRILKKRHGKDSNKN